jgi:excisionase family DNA binding protein
MGNNQEQIAEQISSLHERLNDLEGILRQLSDKVDEPPLPLSYLSVIQAGEYLGISKSSVYRLIESGAIPYTNVGKRNLRLRIEDLDKYLHKRKVVKKSIL